LPIVLTMDTAVTPAALAKAGPSHETELLRAELALERERHALLQRVTDSAPAALLVLDGQGRARLVNALCRQWFGIGCVESRGAADAHHVREALAAAVHDGAALLRWVDEARVRHEGAGGWDGAAASGVRLEGHARSIALPEGGRGCLLRWVEAGAHGEIEALRREAGAARGADRAKTDFLSHASHELRTPLNAVLGFAQLLGRSPALQGSPEQGFAEHILQAGRHLQALIDDLLQLSGVDSGHIAMRRERIELGSVVDSALTIVQPMAAEQGVTLEWAGAELAWLHADATRMRQLLINLLSNAIKYNRRGGRVEVALRGGDAAPHLSIADTGLGMSAHQLAHLFEPFNRLGAERSRIQGTGLGMAISRQLAERMGARLEVESEPGAGTTVHIRWGDPAQDQKGSP
jgi:signal transduction histidine kinase